MINKRFEIDVADINSKAINIIDVPKSITESSVTGISETRLYYPIEIQIINDCGAGVEFLILSNSDEYKKYQADPAGYSDFVRLPKNASLTDDFTPFNKCYKFLVRGYETTASSKLILEFINYKPRME